MSEGAVGLREGRRRKMRNSRSASVPVRTECFSWDLLKVIPFVQLYHGRGMQRGSSTSALVTGAGCVKKGRSGCPSIFFSFFERCELVPATHRVRGQAEGGSIRDRSVHELFHRRAQLLSLAPPSTEESGHCYRDSREPFTMNRRRRIQGEQELCITRSTRKAGES